MQCNSKEIQLFYWENCNVGSERVAILVSGFGFRQLKFLDAPIIPNLTGEPQYKATRLLEEWKISKVVGIVFDTTASNTGRWKGAASLIEKKFNYVVRTQYVYLLCLACRHHFYEIHVKHVGEKILVSRNGPSEKLFVRFQAEAANALRTTNFHEKIIVN